MCNRAIMMLIGSMVLSTSVDAGLSGLVVISEQYAANGNVDQTDVDGQTLWTDSYDETAGHPVTKGVRSDSLHYADSWTQECDVTAGAGAEKGTAGAFAAYTVVFQPLYNSLVAELRMCLSPYSDVEAYLTDLTTGARLFDDRWRDEFGYSYPYDPAIIRSWGVDPAHTYTFGLLAHAWANWDVSNECSVELLLTSVPAPAGSSLLLSGMGMALVGWLRRRKTL